MSKNATSINGMSPTNVRIFGRKLRAESVLLKKYEKTVEQRIAEGEYSTTSIARVSSAAGCLKDGMFMMKIIAKIAAQIKIIRPAMTIKYAIK